MDLKFNGNSFQGKKEVLYGLTKAAKEARSIEVNKILAKGPRPMNTASEIDKSNAAMKAYLDMSVNDDSFVKTIDEAAKNEADLKPIKEFLKSEVLQKGVIKPFETFKKALVEISSSNDKNNGLVSLENFFKGIN